MLVFEAWRLLHKDWLVQGGLIAPGQGGLRTPPCTPLYFGVRGVHASLFEGARPARPLVWGMHASKRRAYAQQACTPPWRGVHSLHARPKGRARPSEGACTPVRRGVHALPEGRECCARPSREACTSVARLSEGVRPGSRDCLPGRRLREPCGV